jgi:hypothetical protein
MEARGVNRNNLLRVLMDRIRATGLGVKDQDEIYNRLRDTDTSLLQKMVEQDAVGQAVSRAMKRLGSPGTANETDGSPKPSPDGQTK